MASGGQSLDELMAQLVGMGFEFQDAQDAIKAGKLSLNDAIEWIVAGKPLPQVQSTSGSSVLKLGSNRNAGSEGSRGAPVGANPFSNPQPVALPSAQSSQPPLSTVVNPYQDDGGVVSRTRMNEEQRKIKERFEQKQREEVRKTIKQQRVSTKKAHEATLKQIQEDRERQKLMRPAHASTEPPPPPPATESATPQPKEEQNTASTALLQIRLPDGRALREKFNAEAPLKDVHTFVLSKARNLQDVTLMQPFPRQEFSSEHMNMSLRQLNLAPSGSLVVKKSEAPQAVEPAPMETSSNSASVVQTDSGSGSVQGEEMGVAPPVPVPPAAPQPVLPFVHDVIGTHNWGEGHHMNVDTEQPEQQPQAPAQQHEEMEEEANSDESEDEGAAGGVNVGAGGQGGFGWGNFAAGMQYQQQHNDSGFVGAGHVLAGPVLNPDNMPHHQRSPAQLAAEAARQRYGQPAPPVETDRESSPPLLYTVPSLLQLLIQHVCGRICDTRHPLTGMQGVPASVGIKVVEYLMKEKLLKPKTLHIFVSCRLTDLVLDCYPHTTNELLRALRLHVCLNRLSLGSCSLINDVGLQPLTALKMLKHLSLSGCRQLTNNCLPIVADFPQLVSLNLENTGVTDVGVIEYAQTSPANLCHLNLNKTEVTHAILPALQTIHNLKGLSLELTQVASLSGIQSLSGLETLNLCGTPIVTDALLCLSSQVHPRLLALNIANTPNVHGDLALQYLHDSGLKLEALQLPSRMSTTDAGIGHISGMLLQTLDLTNYMQIGDVAMRFVGQIHTLRKLRLSNTKVSDAGLLLLEGLQGLEELYVDRVPTVSDVGLQVIKEFSQLEELSLSETGISNTLLRSNVLNHCARLSKLNLSKNLISSKGVACLKLPHLKLLNLDGTRVRAEVEETLRLQCPELTRVSLVHIEPVSAVDEETDNW